MITKLIRIGDDLAVVLDRTLLEELGLDESSEVELFTNGKVVAAIPHDPAKHRDVMQLVAELDQLYGGVFRRLAAS